MGEGLQVHSSRRPPQWGRPGDSGTRAAGQPRGGPTSGPNTRPGSSAFCWVSARCRFRPKKPPRRHPRSRHLFIYFQTRVAGGGGAPVLSFKTRNILRPRSEVGASPSSHFAPSVPPPLITQGSPRRRASPDLRLARGSALTQSRWGAALGGRSPPTHPTHPPGALWTNVSLMPGNCQARRGVLHGTARHAAGSRRAPGASPGVWEGGRSTPLGSPALQPPLGKEKQVAFGAKALAPPLIFMEIKRAG